MRVKTRFAPSPTGFLHVGGARTALYSWLYAQHHQGEFFLRVEDTDSQRSTQQAVDAIFAGMQWLGLHWNGEVVFQTQRFERYQSLIDQFIAQGKAYRCNCSTQRLDALREQQMAAGLKPRYDGHCREKTHIDQNTTHVIRFKTPQSGQVSFTDQIRGKITVDNTELDDLIIRRSDGNPTYNFCVVIDDWDMQITHVIRGEDHINNTPRQIHIYQALGAHVPVFAHVGMILGDDGAKLSKRHGAVSVMQYRDQGFLPQALLNYLVRLGWSHGDQEIFSTQEMIETFELNAVSKSSSAFNTEKLRWLNQHYMRHLPVHELASALLPHFNHAQIDLTDGPDLEKVIPLYVERSHTLIEFVEDCCYLYRKELDYDALAVDKHLQAASEVMDALYQALEHLTDWQSDAISTVLKNIARSQQVGMGKVGMPLRVALTGRAQSPAVNEIAYLLGRESTLKRIRAAMQIIASQHHEH